MKNIRYNIFETNSSSSHSISLSDISDGIMNTIKCNNKGIITLVGGDFGWEYQKYNDPLTKANYCVTDQYHRPDNIEILKEVIKDHTGCKKVNIELSTNAYIDHQSRGTTDDIFSLGKEAIRQFIFNDRAYLFTGNDNDMAPPNFYDTNPNIKYKYILKIEEIDQVFKFAKKPKIKEIKQAIYSLMEFSKVPNNFQFTPTTFIANGKRFRSLNLKDKKISLFHLNYVYLDNGRYIGPEVYEIYEINFSVEKI